MGSPSFISLSNYLKHKAQWQSWETLGSFGETSVTTTQTVNCLYFEGYVDLGNAGPVRSANLMHQALLYSTPTVKIGDKLVAITDQFGNELQASATVVRVEKFTKPSRGVVLQQVVLEFH